ncbi:MAG TPA: hypothetical protein VK892_11705 [Pyrinomonadaceae bacterium]|nr:hypothetical protein [Pyrinomonadaceae bacterium]
MNILCQNCGKDSGIEKSGPDGTDAAHIQRLNGWMTRLPALVGIFEWFFACSESCMKALLEKASLTFSAVFVSLVGNIRLFDD